MNLDDFIKNCQYEGTDHSNFQGSAASGINPTNRFPPNAAQKDVPNSGSALLSVTKAQVKQVRYISKFVM
jgi:hypothetical protein